MWLPGRVHPCHFNPRPRTGSDRGGGISCACCPYFNPRSPHGERRPSGCRGKPKRRDFNPRSPHGERLLLPDAPAVADGISTHAPRTGSDFNCSADSTSPSRFQPTLPARGATRGKHRHNYIRHFNLRSPHGERPRGRYNAQKPLAISTHAPHTGSDRWNGWLPSSRTYFNPRSPHGERPCVQMDSTLLIHFNPRSPHGERQGAAAWAAHPQGKFQPTLPARGATG